MDTTTHIPELEDALYCTEVMHLRAGKSELVYDRELLKKAHGLGIMATLPSVAEAQRVTSSASDSTESTSREQTFSTISEASTTYLTPHSSIYGGVSPKLSSFDSSINKPHCKALNFASYEKYISQIDTVHEEPRFRKPSLVIDSSGQSIFSVSTRKSISGVTTGFRNRMRLRKKPTRLFDTPVSCFACQAAFNKTNGLKSLPCGHAHCTDCIRDLVIQAINHETRMPPTCCAQPVPADALKQSLDLDVQESFLKAVHQYSTPSESRIFCCSTLCGEFIPPLKRLDPKLPSAVTCLKCQTKVCSTCKQSAHSIGIHCPGDWELLDALKIGGRSSWRRCYRCRKLVELSDSIGPTTCACSAQFCHSCGGVWDSAVGCPNVCNGEEGLAKRRKEEEERAAQAKAVREAERQECEERSASHPSMIALRASQEQEKQRLLDFRCSAESSLKARHAAEGIALMNQQVEEEEQLSQKHSRETSQLDDRQIAEELELRQSLEQAEKSIRVRIKHMEAYCDGLGQNPNGSALPPRIVTEQNLRDLGIQYNLRDDMERQHQSKINMMRDRQEKRMEELLEKHETDLQDQADGQRKARDELIDKHKQEAGQFHSIFDGRQSRTTARWTLAIEVLCKELQEQDGLKYAVVDAPSWPENAVPTVVES
ncbi:IBR domain protein [Metarhizium robertsii]|uniref:IBR domain-containing protein n=2 Tax=Metarhizium robertsii TaxID=568076 RepID=E9EUX8_METRA|nr:IBR domain-containing protein [Metarhizium robertsii ARSEF 23]EFZ01231.2 IBR domain-containing protein [Metarhizium robertsii ARSEF 23]EXV03805.1 IBR domain protein [Metarhizium robertsii]